MPQLLNVSRRDDGKWPAERAREVAESSIKKASQRYNAALLPSVAICNAIGIVGEIEEERMNSGWMRFG